MQINVAQQLKAPVGTSRRASFQEVGESPNGGATLVHGELNLTRTDRGILVQGTMTLEARVECSRCLREFDYPLTLSIEEEYYPTHDVLTGATVSLPQEERSFTIDEDHIINLAEAVRQYSILGLPMKPLCRPECAGLCPRCGQNLNEGPCSCSVVAPES